jgi:hypothetical protein
MTGGHSRARKWLLLGVFAGAVVVIGVFAWRARHIDDWTHDWIVRSLAERFDSQVELASVHVAVLPEMNVSGEGLSIRYQNRFDVPPLIRIESFTFHLGFMGIVRVPRHIGGVHLDRMTITVPPRGEKPKPAPPPAGKERRPLPKITIDHVICDDTSLFILPKKEGKSPLDFEIHDLVLLEVGTGKPFYFHGNLTNARPQGEIGTKGNFGPWNPLDPGATPVEGDYNFAEADLGGFRGIDGTLASTGKFTGQLRDLEVEGHTDTPDFSLDPVGHPVSLHTEFSATVDGTNGDTYLHPVRATLLHSLIIARGSVIRAPGKPGHIIALDVVAPQARIEDVLRLGTKSDKPFITGALNLTTKFLLPPGKTKVIDKLKLDGEFSVTEGQWTSSEIREKLESFSRHAQGQPQNPEVGDSVTHMHGRFHLEAGVITFRRLAFSVSGADILLDGNFKLRGEELDFKGSLRMQARLSQTVTGAKSFFLRAIDLFFAKGGAGTLLPITITGTRDQPVIGVTVLHKTVRRQLGGMK